MSAITGLTLAQIIALGSGVEQENDLPDIMKEAIEQSTKEKRTATLQTLTGVLKSGQEEIKEAVAELRKIRSQETKQESKVKNLQKAFDHFKTTGNPLPYYKVTGDSSAIIEFFEQVGLDSEDFPTNHPVWQIPSSN